MTVHPTLADVTRARERISSRILRTPLVRSEWLSRASGAEIFLKLESLQVTHSFKSRGALNAILALLERQPAGRPPPTIVTASAGNHGRGLAWAAEQLGVPTIVFTPRNAPRTKLDAIRRHGADLRAQADTYEDSERQAKAFAASGGGVFVSAYSHPDVMAAIGTIALEILEDRPSVDQVIVPVGGGGLAGGIAAAAKAVKPAIEIVGVEAEASHAFADSLAAGRIVEVQVGPTIADGLAGNMDPDNLAFPLVQSLVDRMSLASEEGLHEAIRGLLREEHLVTEGAGAAGIAALLAGRVRPRGQSVVVISGANIDLDRLLEILRG